MANILIVDDELQIRETLVEYFEAAGHTCFEGSDGIDALGQLKQEKVDAVILDVMMPNMDGVTTCKEIKQHYTIPVIFLTARNTEYDTLAGLTLGADDYITKPFNAKIVVAKIEALLRAYNHTTPRLLHTFENLTFDATAEVIHCNNTKLNLSATEFKLLSYLIKHPNQLFTREYLLDTIWGYSTGAQSQTVTTHVSRINRKLKNSNTQIISERGRGYRIIKNGAGSITHE